MPAILSFSQTGNIEQSQRVIDMADKIFLLQPEETPFTTLLRKLARRAAINPLFNWLEDELRPWVTTAAAAQLVGDTTTTVAAGTGQYFLAGDIFKNMSTGEVILVVSVAGDVLTITRGFGGSTAVAIASGNTYFLMAQQNAEGAATPTARMTKKVKLVNYTQIFRSVLQVSNTLQASKLYGVDNERAFQRAKIAKEHNMQIERAFWFGLPNENLGGSPGPIRSTGGVDQFLTTNVTNLANEAAFTQSAFETFWESVFLYGSSRRFLFASLHLVSLINLIAANNIRFYQMELGKAKDVTYGMQVGVYNSAHGEVIIVPTRILKDWSGGSGFTVNGKVGYAVDIDQDGAAYRFLRDTILKLDTQLPGTDAVVDEYLTEAGLQLANQKFHGRIAIQA
jgi:hypothetical protein